MRDTSLATPAYQFTIPSSADGLLLDCRIYHPQSLAIGDDYYAAPTICNKKGAIVAHPYAPLGGCMDDPVVIAVVEQLLDMDLVVGTFNFRGAAGSKGSTTWTGKGEREDYISFAGCLIHYLNNLSVYATSQLDLATNQNAESVTSAPTRTSPQASATDKDDDITIIFGGYSYGSLIVSQIPEIHDLLQHMAETSHETFATEIILRAQQLATQTNESHDQRLAQRGRRQDQTSHGHRKSNSHHSVTYGGEEPSSQSAAAAATARDRSREGGSGHSIDIPSRIKNRIHNRRRSKSIMRRSSSYSATTRTGSQPARAETSLPGVRALYLLISPLLPPLSAFLAPSFSSYLVRTPEPYTLSQNPTLVIYGAGDGFTSARRMRAWCRRIEARSVWSDFTVYEQEDAGHFWRERGAIDGLIEAVERWTKKHIESSVY